VSAGRVPASGPIVTLQVIGGVGTERAWRCASYIRPSRGRTAAAQHPLGDLHSARCEARLSE
jgi:hypothetical protein